MVLLLSSHVHPALWLLWTICHTPNVLWFFIPLSLFKCYLFFPGCPNACSSYRAESKGHPIKEGLLSLSRQAQRCPCVASIPYTPYTWIWLFTGLSSPQHEFTSVYRHLAQASHRMLSLLSGCSPSREQPGWLREETMCDVCDCVGEVEALWGRACSWSQMFEGLAHRWSRREGRKRTYWWRFQGGSSSGIKKKTLKKTLSFEIIILVSIRHSLRMHFYLKEI